MNDVNDLLAEGIAAAKAGQRAKARALLREVIRLHPTNATAWLWMSGVAESDAEKRQCLETVLTIDPGNPYAGKGLQKLNAGTVPVVEDAQPNAALQPVQLSHTPQPASFRNISQPAQATNMSQSAGNDALPQVTRKPEQAQAKHTVLWILAAICICVLAAILVSKIPSSPSTAKPSVKWEMIPTQIKVSPASDGWQQVSIIVAFENQSTEFSRMWLHLSITGTTLVTKEGYSYPTELVGQWVRDLAHPDVNFPLLPPGFRFKGLYGGIPNHPDTYYGFTAKIAENTHPKKLSIPGFGDVDLLETPVTFPGGETYDLLKAGDSVRVGNRAKITILKFEKDSVEFREGSGITSASGDRVAAFYRIENLSTAYATTLNMRTLAIGSDGLVGDYGVRDENRPCGAFLQLREIGPGQQIEGQFCIVLPRNSRNVRFIFTGDVQAVFDTGY